MVSYPTQEQQRCSGARLWLEWEGQRPFGYVFPVQNTMAGDFGWEKITNARTRE